MFFGDGSFRIGLSVSRAISFTSVSFFSVQHSSSTHQYLLDSKYVSRESTKRVVTDTLLETPPGQRDIPDSVLRKASASLWCYGRDHKPCDRPGQTDPALGDWDKLQCHNRKADGTKHCLDNRSRHGSA